MSGYLTVDGEFVNTKVIERSKFICYLKGINNEEEAKAYVESIRKLNGLATHNCYAYIADEKGLVQKFSDDGEPQGTAGMPMLNALKGKKLFKVVAVVTRYFGGIKLGAGGLVRAYGGSVGDCVESAKLCRYLPTEIIKISADYDGYSRIMSVISGYTSTVMDTNFENGITVTVAIAKETENTVKSFCDKLVDVFNGKIKTESIREDYLPFKNNV